MLKQIERQKKMHDLNTARYDALQQCTVCVVFLISANWTKIVFACVFIWNHADDELARGKRHQLIMLILRIWAQPQSFAICRFNNRMDTHFNYRASNKINSFSLQRKFTHHILLSLERYVHYAAFKLSIFQRLESSKILSPQTKQNKPNQTKQTILCFQTCINSCIWVIVSVRTIVLS